MSNTNQAISREPGYWLHKTRALLLPTPLAVVDGQGEAARTEKVLEWLGAASASWRSDEWFEDCRRDALAIHVFEDEQVGRALSPEDEVSLPPLLHPMCGKRPPQGEDLVATLAELNKQYEDWFATIKAKAKVEKEAPTNSREYSGLWHTWQRSLESSEFNLLSRLPGHLYVRDHSIFAHRSVAAALVGARFDGDAPVLLNVHCGPVQSFIGAARRTSDLWLGSFLVNLLAYQAVRVIAEQCGPDTVIYPHLATLPLAQLDLGFCEQDRRQQQCRWLRAAQPNRFVALVDGKHAVSIAKQAASAVLERWKLMGKRVKGALRRSYSTEFEESFADFDRQIAEHLEVDVVVQPWPDEPAQIDAMLESAGRPVSTRERGRPGDYYAEVFGLGRQTLTAQRELQTFATTVGNERRKCTLCGLREQLGPLEQTNRWWKELREHLRCGSDKGTLSLRSGEALCAVCITKRFAHCFDLAGSNSAFGLDWDNRDDRVLLRFPSVASVASAPFRAHLARFAGHEAVRDWLDKLAKVDDLLNFEPPGNLLPGLGDIGRGKRVLDCEGTWLYARTYESDTVARDHDLDADEAELKLAPRVRAAGQAFDRVRKALAKQGEEPVRATPYYAVIVADIDKMGHWLEGTHYKRPSLAQIIDGSGMVSLEVAARAVHAGLLDDKRRISTALHAEVSRRQGELCTNTLQGIVEQHLGRVVYSGGDDLLAFVPLHTLWSCLSSLSEAFRASKALGEAVGVSAGVAILDWRAPLSLALRKAQNAEKRAKGDEGDRVALTLDVRSGAPLELELSWELMAKLPKVVEELVESGEQHTAPILRPAAVERMRSDLEITSAAGLEKAFRARATKLLGAGAQPPPWFEQLLLERERQLDPRAPVQLGKVLDVLLLIRFLARERGGLPLWTSPAKEAQS